MNQKHQEEMQEVQERLEAQSKLDQHTITTLKEQLAQL